MWICLRRAVPVISASVCETGKSLEALLVFLFLGLSGTLGISAIVPAA